jgi:hypothetical protein
VGRGERSKGVRGEREVAALYEGLGLEVRGLEGAGDHLVVAGASSGIVLHSEVKRQEVARPWAWYEQASSEAPPGTIAVVHFRRNHSPWLALLGAGELGYLVASLENARAALEEVRAHVAELERRGVR